MRGKTIISEERNYGFASEKCIVAYIFVSNTVYLFSVEAGVPFGVEKYCIRKCI